MKQKLKVLYLCPNGYLGGAERFVVEVNRSHLKSQVIDSTILFFHDGAAVELARQYGLNVILLKNIFKMRQLGKLFLACLEIRKIVKENNFNLIHATMPYAHIVSFLTTVFLPVKRVWFQHGPIGGPLDVIANLLPKDMILFNSTYTQEQHYKLRPRLYAEKGEYVVPLAVPQVSCDPVAVSQIRHKYINETKRYLLLCAGRISRGKGYELAIEALAEVNRVAPECYSKIHLLIVGDAALPDDKLYLQELQKRVEETATEQNISFLGHQAQIHNFFKAADVFLLTTKIAEAFGLVAAEAMMQETLVVGTNYGGITDILKNEETGYTLKTSEEDSVATLATLLRNIINQFETSDPQIAEIKQNAKKLITNNYSSEQLNKTLEGEYLQCLGSGGRVNFSQNS